MMLGHPKTVVAKPLGMLRQVGGVVERMRGVGALRNGCEVENGQWDHRPHMGSPAPHLNGTG
jgi:hypothetical protein